MNIRQFWTSAEEAAMLDLAARGHTAPQIAAALPGRSAQAIRSRLRDHGKGPGHKTPTSEKAAVSVRVEQLRATIDRAMAERRPDWDWIDGLIGGLQGLTARAR